MILARVHNVKSGWKSVFIVFTIGAREENDNIVQASFVRVFW